MKNHRNVEIRTGCGCLIFIVAFLLVIGFLIGYFVI